jgi:lysophospholipase L1-like esterase
MTASSGRRANALRRYVAVGDSQTEGLDDFDRNGALRGWADRFAESLAVEHPGLLYANLAVRGKRTSEIRRSQLDAALALEPDLVTVVSGVNDVVRPSVDVGAVAADLEAMYAALAASGARVLGCTFPLPRTGLSRYAAPRLQALNAGIRAAARRHGVLLVEVEGVDMASDLRLWSRDRIHLNSEGHRRLAAAFVATLAGRPGHDWMEPLPAAPARSTARRVADEATWLARFVVPKLVRLARGRSSGDGRSAKRPTLRPIGLDR